MKKKNLYPASSPIKIKSNPLHSILFFQIRSYKQELFWKTWPWPPWAHSLILQMWPEWWWKVHKRWSSLKSGVKKRIHSKKRSRYLLWAILELRALCEGAAAAAKSETKNLSTCRIVTKANTLGVISFQWWFFMLNRGTHLRHQGALFGLVVKI